MNKSLQDKVKLAFKEIINQSDVNIPNKIEDTLSDNFYHSLMRQVEADKKYIMVFGKAISKIAIFILILAILGTLTVYAMIKTKFIYKIFDKNTYVNIDMLDSGVSRDKIDSVYEPRYILNYNLDSRISDETAAISTYINDESDMITIFQQITAAHYNYDNEDTDETIILVNGSEAVYFEKPEYKECTLIFEKDGYLFELQAPLIGQEEMVKVAESLHSND